ncbi:MAG: hypothetical protein IT422_15095 [Pirellulaceae bacterium]|nr:hypothetical protein [Pirellulaceae bacterium]
MTRNFAILSSTASRNSTQDERITVGILSELLGIPKENPVDEVRQNVDAQECDEEAEAPAAMFPYSRLLLNAPILRPSIFNPDLRDEFPAFARAIDAQFVPGQQLVVCVDEVELTELNALVDHGWNSLVAMLVLAFPDVRWVFFRSTAKPTQLKELVDVSTLAINEIVAYCNNRAVVKLADDAQRFVSALRSAFSIDQLMLPQSNPLFDDSGLRWWIKFVNRYDNAGKTRSAGHLPDRIKRALVLDEEREFREMHALMAYGRNLRVEVIESWSQAIARLGPGSHAELIGGSQLTLEDLYLNYPDQATSEMSDLEKRSYALPALVDFKHRRFVTVGHRRRDPDGMMKHARQQRWLAEQRLKHQGKTRLKRREQLILKPAAGIYHMWNKLGLDRHIHGKTKRGTEQQQKSTSEDGHSSPGRLLQIAEFLVARAKRLRGEVQSVGDAVRGAVLAIQSHELLGGKTPVLWLDAITLQQEFEVTAECQFAGVQNHLDIRTRMNEIRELLQSQVADYFGGNQSTRKHAVRNGELAILERIVDVLRRYDQFDEEQQVMRSIRDIQRQLSFANRSIVFRVFQPLVWYIHKLVGSVPTFVTAIVAWILALGVLHWLVAQRYIEQVTTAQALKPVEDRFPIPDFDQADGLATAFITFLGLGPADNGTVWSPEMPYGALGALLVSFTVFLGFIHLGVFVAIVNSIIQRK